MEFTSTDAAPFEAFSGFDNDELDFHKWRANSLGSSDMPVIMGVSPYKTPYTLWNEKVDKSKIDFTTNYAMQYGKDMEPIIREWYNDKTNSNMQPERKIHTEFDYLRANADGVDHVKKRMIEIKTIGLELHDAGVVPDKYLPQCVFLSLIFGYPIDYVSYNEKSEEPYKIIEVNIMPLYVDLLLNKAHEFWEMVQTKTPPPYVDEDVIEIDDKDVSEMLTMYGELKDKIEQDNLVLKSIHSKLQKVIEPKRSSCNGYKMTWVDRKGSIDYSKVKGVDFEQYRKKPTRFFTIKKIKKDEK